MSNLSQKGILTPRLQGSARSTKMCASNCTVSQRNYGFARGFNGKFGMHAPKLAYRKLGDGVINYGGLHACFAIVRWRESP